MLFQSLAPERNGGGETYGRVVDEVYALVDDMP